MTTQTLSRCKETGIGNQQRLELDEEGLVESDASDSLDDELETASVLLMNEWKHPEEGREGVQVVYVHINGRPIEALFDTGAKVCVMRLATAQQLGLTILQPRREALGNADGGRMPCLGLVENVLDFKGCRIQFAADVLENLVFPLIIGEDFMINNGIVIDYETGSVDVGSELHRDPTIIAE
jgi:hypothetical protein